MLDVFSPVEGNDYVVEMLAKCLEEAREGKICHCCVIMTTNSTTTNARFSGVSGMEMAANYACDLLKKELMDTLQSRMLVPHNPDAPANRVFYDLYRMPVSFDFAGFLLKAEMTRVRENAPGPLQVGWYLGPQNDLDAALNTPVRKQYFYGIMRPLVRLIGAVEDNTAIDGRTSVECQFAPIVEAYKGGEPLPKFSAPPQYGEGIDEFLRENGTPAPVTITLREAKHSPHRNSNLPEWIKLAEWLKEQGESVIFIRDTAKARELIPDQCTCFAASEDLLIRTALYSRAKANLFVSNGPHILTMFMDNPWLTFIEIQDDHHYKAGTTKGWSGFMGVPAGEQFPWCRDDQHIIWQRDTFEVMRDAYIKHIQANAERKVA